MHEKDPIELVADEPNHPLSDRIVLAAPWWAVSGFFHLIIAVICMYIIALLPKLDSEVPAVIRTPTPPSDPIRPFSKEIQPKELDIPERSQEQVIMPAVPSDHTENPTDEDFKKVKGESSEALTNQPFKGRGTSGSIGAGSGGGGVYGGRHGGKELLVAKGGGHPGSLDAVMNALRWLARHQNEDGSWSAQGHTRRCGRIARFQGVCSPVTGEESFNVGLTGLSLLAFLGAGYTHLSRDLYDGIRFGDVVRNGVKYLQQAQDASGRVGAEDVSQHMYNHLIAGFALAEAFGMTNSVMVRDSAQRALDYTLAAQNPGKGWRYRSRSGDTDSSVTGWAAQQLKSAEIAGLTVPREAYAGVLAWYDEVTPDSYWRTGYTDSRAGKVVKPGVNERFGDHPALTAISVMARVFIRGRGEPAVRGGTELMLADLPEWDSSGLKVDLYYWYYGSFAMFQAEGPKSPRWTKWNDAIKKALLETQDAKEGDCRHGSWEPVDRWSSDGGRVYTTALGALTLQVYYRYAFGILGGH